MKNQYKNITKYLKNYLMKKLIQQKMRDNV